ncbi:MAG: hypothetical protein HY549_08720 [Elusimicrobia bacterium]|nr:hypothetical protein [Elusimicrobiota bacterium]
MSKKVKKKSAKKEGAASVEAPAAAVGEKGSKEVGYLIRAIRVKPEMLEAAKAYKKATGISFYRLGEESIAAVLIKEGYLKAAKVGASA